jgi:negative regulator of sigma E activity
MNCQEYEGGMNCQEFERGIEVLARGALADARARAESLLHEESCAACAARLADERALSLGLRALASEMKDTNAPARVESALLKTFRARAGSIAVGDGVSNVLERASNTGNIDRVVPLSADNAVPLSSDNVVPLSAHSKTEHWSWVKTLAVAGLAAAAALALFVLVRPGASVPELGTKGEVAEAPTHAEMPDSEQRNPVQLTAPSVAQNDSSSDDKAVHTPFKTDDGFDKIARASSALRRPTGRVRPVNAVFNANGALNSQAGSSAATEGTDSQQEVATEFIPLMQGTHYAQAEGGHLVRVELPRSALASFGLPVNTESGGRVKADVWLGDDGLARAIRFVR